VALSQLQEKLRAQVMTPYVTTIDFKAGTMVDRPAFPPELTPAESGLVIREQVGAGCQTRGRPYLYNLDETRFKAAVIRPDCKMWKCPYCAEKNRVKWAYRIRYGIEQYEREGDSFWFVTLTTSRHIKTFEKSLAVWRHGWDKLYHRMKRYNPKPMHYVLLPELAPETGRLHAHMIVNCSFGAEFKGYKPNGDEKWVSRWLKDKPAECGLGYMNDIRRMTNAGLASWYVSKYVGKSLGVEDWPEHFRRVRPNVDFPEQPDIDDEYSAGEWSVIQAGRFTETCFRLWQAGYDIIDIKSNKALEIDDLEGDE
jgi:hypothetical protein